MVNVVYVYISGNTTGGFAINDVSVLLNVPFIFIVALHSSYFAEKSNEDARDRKNLGKANVEMGVKIKDTDIEIGTLMNFIFRVYDAFKDGVLVTDKNGYVKVFNIAAENIFNTRRSNVTNMHIGDIETLGAVKDTITKLITRKEVTVDKEIIIDSGKLKKISVSTVFIKNKSGDSLGVLCTMRRLTGELEKPQEFK